MIKRWDDLAKVCMFKAKKLGDEYVERLEFEFKEIVKQGANEYWLELTNSEQKFDHNKNGLVIAFLINATDIDPIKEGIEHNCPYIADFPDIDTDFLPYARDEIKRYAAEKYGDDKVCTVGNWNTFKLKQAIQDACRVLEGDISQAIRLTKVLNDDEFDTMDAEELCEHSKEFKEYYDSNKEIIDLALELRGRIKSQGQHAGGIIISSEPLSDVVPMTIRDGKSISQWTEGMASTQLSPVGLVKFDILGLKTMAYNVYAEELIKKSRGITIDWNECDPSCNKPYAGYEILPDGEKLPVLFNDEVAINMADEVRTEAVFQFDTHVAKGVLSNGVTNFHDLVAYTALARPGPMDMIPEYVARRDDPKKLWIKKEDPRVVEMLKDTHGIIVYQEQLTKFWTKFGGLTVPEAEKARKSVAKKKKEEVLKLGPKIVEGMIKNGFEDDPKPRNDDGIYEKARSNSAQGWWNKMVTFGRYCFNKSHAYAYGVVAYRSLWLKAHYPTEFWSSILTFCHPDKISKYVGVARSEGVNFERLKVGHLHDKLTVDSDLNVYPSLVMVKGIGQSVADSLTETGGYCTSIDDFVNRYGKKKGPLERLIKLGAFEDVHPGIRKAVWFWYQYKYCSKNPETDRVREIFNKNYMDEHWPEDKIQTERERQEKEFKSLYPKKKVPAKITKWMPKIGHKYDKPNFEEFIDFWQELWVVKKPCKDADERYFHRDWNDKNLLNFEKEYLGVYWSSPMRLFNYNSDYNFQAVKEDEKNSWRVDGIIEKINKGVTKNGHQYRDIMINDGTETNAVRVWETSLKTMDKEPIKEGVGVRMFVDWSDKYQNFNLSRNTTISALPLAGREL